MLCPHGYLGNHRSHSRDNTSFGRLYNARHIPNFTENWAECKHRWASFFSVLSLFLLLLVFYAWYCFAEIRIKHRTLKGSDKTFRLGATQEIRPYPTSHFLCKFWGKIYCTARSSSTCRYFYVNSPNARDRSKGRHTQISSAIVRNEKKGFVCLSNTRDLYVNWMVISLILQATILLKCRG